MAVEPSAWNLAVTAARPLQRQWHSHRRRAMAHRVVCWLHAAGMAYAMTDPQIVATIRAEGAERIPHGC